MLTPQPNWRRQPGFRWPSLPDLRDFPLPWFPVEVPIRAAWAKVGGTTHNSGANPSSDTITYTVTATNNRLILGISYNGTGTLPTVSTVADGVNTWHKDNPGGTGGNDAGYSCHVEVWSCNAVGTGSTAVQVTLSAALVGGDGISLAIGEYSGLDTSTSTAVDVSVSSSGGLGTASSGNTAATNAANELVIGVYGDDGSTTQVFGGSGLTTQFEAHTGIAGVNFGDKDSGATGVQSAAWTSVPAVSTVCTATVYKLSAAVAVASGTPLQSFPIPRGPMNLRALMFQDRTWGKTQGASPDVTVSLTGVSSATAVGTVVPSTNVTISGVSSTTAVGTLLPSTAVSVTGVSSTTAVGTMTPSTTITLSGVSSTTALGTISETHGSTVALTGVAATTAVGTVVVGTAGGGTDFVTVTPASGGSFTAVSPSGSTGFVKVTPADGGSFH